MFPTPPNVIVSPQSSFVVAPMRDFGTLWCVYEHHNVDNALMYVGVCKLIDVFSFPDARQNSEWVKTFGPDEPIIVKIVMTSSSQHACNNARHRQITTLRPHCNANGYSYHGMKLGIVCNETNEQFGSITETARAHNLSQSALSNHLNNKAGFKSVKGRTYRKVTT